MLKVAGIAGKLSFLPVNENSSRNILNPRIIDPEFETWWAETSKLLTHQRVSCGMQTIAISRTTECLPN